MHVLSCKEPGKFEYLEEEYPRIIPGNSLLKIKAIGVCGTDLHAFDGSQPFFQYPRVLGHEIAAEVIETDHPKFQSGQLVSILPYFNCGHCYACQSGKSNCCVSLQVFGVHTDGGMKEYIQVPSDSLVSGEGLQISDLALLEPFSIALHAVKRSNLIADEFVVIVGAGPIGIATATFAQLRGGKVLVLDINDDRLETCRNLVKGIETFNIKSGSVLGKIKDFSHGEMAKIVFDATGNLEAINSSFQYLAHTGRYVLIGLQSGNIQFNHPEFHKREATLMSSRNANREDFEEVKAYMKSSGLDFKQIITHRIPFEELVEKFPSLIDPKNKVIKAIVEF